MKLTSLLYRFSRAPLVASVQASPQSPLDHPDALLRLARASISEGVEVIRLEGVKNIRAIRPEVPVPIIGLLKRSYPNCDVYITPAAQDVDSLLEIGCDVIAIDGTQRARPKGATVQKLVDRIHRRDTLVMADCDTVESAVAAAAAGADVIGTTLAGYTSESLVTAGPDLDVLRAICKAVDKPVVAEGRYSRRWEVEAALRIGAKAVTVGGALNDPVKQTRALMPRRGGADEKVGAVDIGGTWLRFGVFSNDWKVIQVERTPNPHNRTVLLDWIKAKAVEHGVSEIGLGTGGVTDPRTGEVWTAKEYLMPDHVGIKFTQDTLGVPVHAHGDGHASAWGHANLPEFAGKRVATLAIGTGVGCGFVQSGKLWAGRRGEYPRVNDLPSSAGVSYEELLGGIHLTAQPSEDQKKNATAALVGAVTAIRNLYFPDEVVICGSVGLSPWLADDVKSLGLAITPFDHDAGLYGAAALALFPDYMD